MILRERGKAGGRRNLKKNKGSAFKSADKRIEEKGITGPDKKRRAYSSAG